MKTRLDLSLIHDSISASESSLLVDERRIGLRVVVVVVHALTMHEFPFVNAVHVAQKAG